MAKPAKQIQPADSTSATESQPPAQAPAIRGKLGAMVALLRRETGASIPEMMAETGWQAHSVRGAMSGALKRQRGLIVVSDKTEQGRVYRIVEAQA